MTVSDSITLPNGQTFYVCGGLHARAEVTVPSEAIAHMTDEEIGAAVRALMPQALFLYVVEQADWFRMSVGGVAQRPWQVNDEMVAEYEPIFRPHAGRHSIIDEALGIIDAYHTYHANKASKRQKRQEVASNYERLFMSIGRRDGFHCQECGSTHDLQIDHITPLARGGTNDLSNLQLLCGPCNLRKGGN